MKKIFLIVSLVWMSAMSLAQNTQDTQDTIRMKVVGTSAEFSFTAGQKAIYCVDWGDGSEERQACTAGEEKTLTHTYTASNTYDITFFVYEEVKCVPEERGFIDMVWVEGGTFMMGCTAEQGEDCAPDEYPVHQVTLSGYYISKYPVTQAEYKEVMGNYGNVGYWVKGDDKPMVMITWEEAKAFCAALSKKTGETYTLPTEAQWEFAARGGNKSKGYKYSGSNDIDDVAWYSGNSDSELHNVGTRCPNELGIYDMSGNAQAWCIDGHPTCRYNAPPGNYTPYDSASVTDPVVPYPAGNGTYVMVRGGSYQSSAKQHRVSCRLGEGKGSKGYIGIRVVKVPKKTE